MDHYAELVASFHNISKQLRTVDIPRRNDKVFEDISDVEVSKLVHYRTSRGDIRYYLSIHVH